MFGRDELIGFSRADLLILAGTWFAGKGNESRESSRQEMIFKDVGLLTRIIWPHRLGGRVQIPRVKNPNRSPFASETRPAGLASKDFGF